MLKRGELAGLALAALCQQIGHEPRQALVLLGGFHPRAVGEVVGQRDGDVFHDTNIVFPCFRVKIAGEGAAQFPPFPLPTLPRKRGRDKGGGKEGG